VKIAANHLQARALLYEPGGAANVPMCCRSKEQTTGILIDAQGKQRGGERRQPPVLVHQPLNEKGGVGAGRVRPQRLLPGRPALWKRVRCRVMVNDQKVGALVHPLHRVVASRVDQNCPLNTTPRQMPRLYEGKLVEIKRQKTGNVPSYLVREHRLRFRKEQGRA